MNCDFKVGNKNMRSYCAEAFFTEDIESKQLKTYSIFQSKKNIKH